MIQTLAEFFKEGGPFMFVNVATSAVAIAIIVERVIVLAFKLNLNAPPFMEPGPEAHPVGQRRPRREALRRGAERGAVAGRRAPA